MDKRVRGVSLRFFSDYGMLLVLLLLCLFFSIVTYAEQRPGGQAAAAALAGDIRSRFGSRARVLVAVRAVPQDREFADRLRSELETGGGTVEVVAGQPRDARRALERMARGGGLDAIACNETTATWEIFADLGARFPTLADAP